MPTNEGTPIPETVRLTKRKRLPELVEDNVINPEAFAAALKAEWSIGLDVPGLAEWFNAAQNAAVAEALRAVRELGDPTRFPNRYVEAKANTAAARIHPIEMTEDLMILGMDGTPVPLIDMGPGPDGGMWQLDGPGPETGTYRYVPVPDDGSAALAEARLTAVVVGGRSTLDALRAADPVTAWGMADIESTEGAASYLDAVARHITEMQARQIERACADLLRQGHEPVIVKDRDGKVTVMARCDYTAKYGDVQG